MITFIQKGLDERMTKLKISKKLFALAIVAFMLFFLVPFSAFAEDDVVEIEEKIIVVLNDNAPDVAAQNLFSGVSIAGGSGVKSDPYQINMSANSEITINYSIPEGTSYKTINWRQPNFNKGVANVVTRETEINIASLGGSTWATIQAQPYNEGNSATFILTYDYNQPTSKDIYIKVNVTGGFFSYNQNPMDTLNPSENAGGVNVEKSGEWVDIENGIAKVDFTVSGEAVESGSDVVIVLDKSGSTGYNPNGLVNDTDDYFHIHQNLTSAVGDLGNELLASGSDNRVAFVNFADEVEGSFNFVNSQADFNANYYPAAPSGFTHYDKALNKAMEYVKSLDTDHSTEGIQNGNRPIHVIFFSDGSHNNSAYSINDLSNLAKELNNLGVAIHTVGYVDASMSANKGTTLANNLKAISSNLNPELNTNMIINGENSGSSANEFKDILNAIAQGFSTKIATDAVIDDVISEHYEYYEDSTYKPTAGVTHVDGKDVQIQVGDITNIAKTYTFYLELKDYIDTNGNGDMDEEEKLQIGSKYYETNDNATLTYTDINGVEGVTLYSDRDQKVDELPTPDDTLTAVVLPENYEEKIDSPVLPVGNIYTEYYVVDYDKNYLNKDNYSPVTNKADALYHEGYHLNSEGLRWFDVEKTQTVKFDETKTNGLEKNPSVQNHSVSFTTLNQTVEFTVTPQVNITFKADDNGSLTPNGGTSLNADEDVALTAFNGETWSEGTTNGTTSQVPTPTPDSGYRFSHWIYETVTNDTLTEIAQAIVTSTETPYVLRTDIVATAYFVTSSQPPQQGYNISSTVIDITDGGNNVLSSSSNIFQNQPNGFNDNLPSSTVEFDTAIYEFVSNSITSTGVLSVNNGVYNVTVNGGDVLVTVYVREIGSDSTAPPATEPPSTTTPEEEIPDETVPLTPSESTPGDGEEIVEEDVPLVSPPDDEEIVDEDVPLASPSTDVGLAVVVIVTGIAGFGGIFFAKAIRKNKK